MAVYVAPRQLLGQCSTGKLLWSYERPYQKQASCTNFNDVLAVVDDYMDYYNNRRYQWHLAKPSPNEYYHFVTTGEYPLDIPNKPESPVITKSPSQLGSKIKTNNK